jgi:hypothetical protein
MNSTPAAIPVRKWQAEDNAVIKQNNYRPKGHRMIDNEKIF